MRDTFSVGLRKSTLDATGITAPRNHALPDASGTLALTSQLGGGIALVQTTLNVPTPAAVYAEIVLPAAGVTGASKIIANYVRLLDAENDLEEISDTDMSLAAVGEAGQIRFVLSGNSPFVGSFPVTYQVYP